MKKVIIFLLILISFNIFPQKIVTTAHGEKVVLNPNGHWEYLNNNTTGLHVFINSYYSTIITALIGIFGLIISFIQHNHSKRIRKDNLYKHRFDFYQRLSKSWLKTFGVFDDPPLTVEDLIPYSIEADFLFGQDIVKHIGGLEGKEATNPYFPDEDFSKPFEKYLKLR